MCQQFNMSLLLCFTHVDKDGGRGSVKPIFHCNAKTLALGHGVESFALGIPTCWYLKTLNFALPPMQTPNTNRWNIGHVGSPTQNSRVGL